MNKKNFLDKTDSDILIGVAILFMLFHHLFGTPSEVNYTFFCISETFYIGKELVIRIAWLSKVCVAFYAFVSGYGFYIKYQKYDTSFSCLKEIYVSIGKKIFNFLKKFWLVFCIYVPVGYVLNWYEFRYPESIKELVLGFLGLNCVYNGSWWYIR